MTDQANTSIDAVKIGPTIPVSSELLEDAPGELLDRVFRPWKFPDRGRWPSFVLFPRLDRARRWLHERLTRVSDAWAVLRGHASVYDPYGDDT